LLYQTINSTSKYHPLFNSVKAAILLRNLLELDPNPTVRYHKIYILLMLVSNIKYGMAHKAFTILNSN